MQFDAGFGAPRQRARDGVEHHPPPAMQGRLVHLVEGSVHQAREIAFDQKPLARDKTHQVPHRAVLAQGDKGSKITVAKWLQRFSSKPVVHLPREVRGLLVCGLSARGNRLVIAWID
jgi:hypothetical protein